MKRRVRNVLTLLSLLLCVAAGVLWVRSYAWKEGVNVGGRAGICALFVRYGRLTCLADFNRNDRAPAGTSVYWLHDPQSGRGMNLADTPDFAFAGFGFKRHGWAEAPRPMWVVLVPMWFITLGAALPPGLWLAATSRRRLAAARRGKGLCPACGYDLRATPGRCPECGMAASVIPLA